ncbi:hypothetical protein WME77_29605 [Sorangium sp. So ce764]|uniref:hypothetical protein n=1 Tax=Sorangium sp. So ce764 TaxID=3133320 RepID=UPI003F5E1C3E
MSQSAGGRPPDVKPAPAPWALAGDATLVMLELPGRLLREQSFKAEFPVADVEPHRAL